MQSEKSGVSSNVISLPEGGGAMKGMGETFSADLFSGTGNYSVPISVPKGRMGMEPQLSLGYSTGNGNGICGQGWNLSLPGISRKTSLGIPQYRNDEDTFVLSGAEDLIPVAESVEQDGEVRVKRLGYKPRTEGLFARITHITATDGRDYWEVNTKDGKTSVYGNPDRLSENPCRIVDPEDASHIFHWFIFKTYDLLGNEVVYEYDYDVKSDDKYPYSQVYLSRIKYADYPNGDEKSHLCSVKINYEPRPDKFSVFNSGFEIRTKKRIANIETYTHPWEGQLPSGYNPPVLQWQPEAAAGVNPWTSIAYGDGVFVAIAYSGTNSIMRSTDGGQTWEAISSPASNQYISVAYGNGVFIAVSRNGSNRIIRSTDKGITWSEISTAEENEHRGIAFGNGVFVIVSYGGTNRILRSEDGGLSWTAHSTPGSANWNSVTYGDGVFVAVAVTGSGTNLVVRSINNGETWISAAATYAQNWVSVTYGNGTFVAVSYAGTNRVMRSTNGGETWTPAMTNIDSNDWRCVAFGNGLFVALARSGTNRTAISKDGGITWEMGSATENNSWRGITFGSGEFVAVAENGINRVMRLPASANAILVKRYNLTYRDETNLGPIGNGVSLLVNVQVEGHGPDSEVETMPPVEFGYTEFDGSSRDLITLNQDHLPSLSLADPSMNMVDLDGNGLPDFVQIQPGLPIRYWKNRGRGEFDLPRQMKDAPVGLSLTDGSTQFMDADGDGRADMVLNSPRVKGYFPLRYDGQWDEKRYTPYKTTPTVNFASADVQFMDLTGDGRTDVIINSDRSFICYFQNSPLVGKPGETGENTLEPGWSEMRRITKGDLDDFPNVNFSDPRIRTADLSGDGLQDIVMLSNGAVFYWPNLGYGRFGKKRRMKNAPRPGFNFDPNRVILADINGDGLADYIYINYNSVDYWINQSGEAWGEQLEIKGTPRFTSRNSITVTDLMGTGTPGILWTYNAGESRDRMYFVDLTKGQKPYLLNEVDNNLGALTKVHYTPSTEFYLRDLYGESPESFPYIKPVGAWKTTLPFPVLTVSKVEAIDRISQNKLVTRYFYHHGYWDGVEREFRGFGRVDQFDTETFEAYNTDSLVLDENFIRVSPESYSPPVYTKNWFNLGPVQLPNGDWGELDTSDEFWAEDPSILQRPSEFNALLKTLTRRGRRDALRTLRGSAIRSELYAKDGSTRRERPYSVKETQTSVKFIDGPADNPIIENLKIKLNSGCIFFPFQYSSRESMWERGEDPKISFSFTGELDAYGQVLKSLSIAVPRGKDPLTGGQLGSNNYYDPTEPYRAVLNISEYVYKNEAQGLYFVDRIKQSQSEEITGTASQNVFTIRENAFDGNATTNILSHQLNYYDGAAFIGGDFDTLGSYGLLVRSESLIVTPQELTAGYGSNIPPAFSGGSAPDWSGYPLEFIDKLPDPKLGYTYFDGAGNTAHLSGYYATGDKLRYDTQTVGVPQRGMVLAKRDVYDNETNIEYDDYHLLPISVTDPGGMSVSSLIDYRLLAPWQLTDPNENVTRTAFNALGLVTKIAVCGKVDSQGNTQGDTLAVPGTTFTYNFFAFMDDADPISVRKSVREHHINAPYLSSLPTAEQNATIQSAEYSDGYGRLVQSRAQAEDVIYGNQIFGDSGLPAEQTDPNQNAVGQERSSGAPLNVVVSGQKRYNNKGEIVEQYEPYFASGFDYEPDDLPEGVAIKMYYDALGRMVKTVNPDNSEQLVVFGIPEELDTPNEYTATPWERYHYSPNDLAGNTNPGVVPTTSYWTPKSETIDPLGNVIRTTEHKAHYDADTDTYQDVVMQYHFDIKGQLIESIDPFDRVISTNKYSTAGQMLKTTHIDRGEQTLLVDALNLPFVTNDAKGAQSLFAYDNLQRPTFAWARDSGSGAITKRQIMRYGDSDGLPNPEVQNLNGKLYVHNDEAGKLVYEGYDFKGNNLQFYRQIINDDAITAYQKYVVNWDSFNPAHLSNTKNTITQEYDAMNRIRKAFYPNDRDNTRKVMKPTYNKGGALLSLKVDTTDYVREVAYNARGQRILIAYGNKIMTRYAYDPKTFRVLRQRSALFNHSGHSYTPNAGIRQDMQYTYDLEGTITSMNDAAPANTYAQGPGNLLRLFTHDPLRRLLSATGREISNVYSQPSWDLNIRPMDYTDTNTYIRTYRYDKIGNIQNLNHSANGHANQDFNRDYSYDSSDNKLKSFTVNSTTYGNSYDPNGNLTKEGQSRYYEWGANDKLAVFKNQAGTSTPSVYTNYFYNAQGERIKKHTRKGNKIVVTFYMDGGMFETSYTKTVGGGIDNNRFYNTIKIQDDGALLATIRVGNNVDDGTFAIKYIVGDHLNNSTAVLKTTGSLINREEYYPFGETSFGGFQFKRYRYNGKEKDEESGLYEYGQRYYAPWLCRFVSVDPIAESYPQYTSYNYAGNKPITKIDLEGLQEEGAEKQGGAQTDSKGNLTGEYVVKPDQGPTQIAEDLAKVHGVDVNWVKTIDDPRNQKYFEHITGEERYNEHNKSYENLNMNPGDIIYFDFEITKTTGANQASGDSGLLIGAGSFKSDLGLYDTERNPKVFDSPTAGNENNYDKPINLSKSKKPASDIINRSAEVLPYGGKLSDIIDPTSSVDEGWLDIWEQFGSNFYQRDKAYGGTYNGHPVQIITFGNPVNNTIHDIWTKNINDSTSDYKYGIRYVNDNNESLLELQFKTKEAYYDALKIYRQSDARKK